jgi:hypothetical protein
MSSYVDLPVSQVLELSRVCLDRIDACNKKRLAQAIAQYRNKGWWLFRPSKDLTDAQIEYTIRNDFTYMDYGRHARGIAQRFLTALTHAAPGSTVQVSIEDLGFIL